MRTRDRIASLTALGLWLGLTPGFAFEGTLRPPGEVAPPPPPSISRAVQSDIPRPPGSIPRAGNAQMPHATLPRPRAPVPVVAAPAVPMDRPLPPPTAFAPAAVMPVAPFEALKSGTRALRDGQKQKALVSLEYAADQGVVAAKWKLGRMYAEGDGVDQSDFKAYEYFSSIADDHADDNPSGPDARYVANAFVSLGHYYRDGIENSEVRADIGRARRMYGYAASYFGDADAQYHLARLLLDGAAPYRDPRQAARWLRASANKGQPLAQAVLGRMMFQGEHMQRQAARGLMFITLANSNAGQIEPWIAELYGQAMQQATVEERAVAGDMLVRWLNGHRD
jgi:hypothetical protein